MAQKLQGIGVYAFSTDDTRILLAQRGPAARHQHYKWEGVGGELEPGESYEDAAKREFREELGIPVELEGTIAEFEAVTDSNGTIWEAKIYKGRIADTPIIQEPTKCVGFGWFTKAEVQELHRGDLLADYVVKDMKKFGWL